MINILVLEPEYVSNTGWWRLYAPFSVMKIMYPGVFDFRFRSKELNYFDAWNADVIIQARPGSGKPGEQEARNQLMKMAQNIVPGGRRVIVDIDDNILGMPPDHDLYNIYNEKARVKSTRECIELADAVWISTPAFLDTYRADAQVMPNAIPPEWLPNEPAKDNGIFAWRGAKIQMHDILGQGLKNWPMYRDMAKTGVFIGYRPPIEGNEKWRDAPYLDDPEKYFGFMRQMGINYLWKPMVKNGFNDHKSNIAVLEATMSGGVCLTNYAGKPGWEYAVSEPVPYSEACMFWEAAKNNIVENYNLYKTAQARAQSIFSLVPHLLPVTNDK
jgi:hypothetical protein